MIYLVVILAIICAFYVGIIFGISDCKRRFAIPKNAVGVDNDGFIYN